MTKNTMILMAPVIGWGILKAMAFVATIMVGGVQ